MTLVSDCHTTGDAEFEGTVIPSGQIVAHVNSQSPWILYPDTVSTVASHADVIHSLGVPALVS